MCITLPPAPVVATPAPSPAPIPAPAPAPAVGNPPGPPQPATVLDLQNSLVIDQNGVSKTFNQVLNDGGFLSTIGSGSSATVRLRLAIQNTGGTAAPVTVLIQPNYTQMAVSPTTPQQLNVGANNYLTAEYYLMVTNGGGGTFNVTVSIGTNSIVLPIALAFSNP